MKAPILIALGLFLFVSASYSKKDNLANFEKFMFGKAEQYPNLHIPSDMSEFEKQHSDPDFNIKNKSKLQKKLTKKNPTSQSSVKKQRLDRVVSYLEENYKYVINCDPITLG